jgi:hypothetical protein
MTKWQSGYFSFLSFADNPQVKKRVVIALSLLVAAKLLNITVPFFFKHAVDLLNASTGGKLNLVLRYMDLMIMH